MRQAAIVAGRTSAQRIVLVEFIAIDNAVSNIQQKAIAYLILHCLYPP